MLTVFDTQRTPGSLSRRRFLQVGALGASSFTLPNLLDRQALATL